MDSLFCTTDIPYGFFIHSLCFTSLTFMDSLCCTHYCPDGIFLFTVYANHIVFLTGYFPMGTIPRSLSQNESQSRQSGATLPNWTQIPAKYVPAKTATRIIPSIGCHCFTTNRFLVCIIKNASVRYSTLDLLSAFLTISRWLCRRFFE